MAASSDYSSHTAFASAIDSRGLTTASSALPGVNASLLATGFGFLTTYAQSQAAAAAGINQQTGYLLQARDNLAVANVRAQFAEQYAVIQAGRILQKSQNESRNFQIAGNQLLKNMRATNAAIRARAAASGVVLGEGSVQAVQNENVRNTMFDVGITDLNALTARILGYEDAVAMVQSTEYQNMLNIFAAERQGAQYEQAGTATRRQGGLLADTALAEGGFKALERINTKRVT